MGSIFAPKVSAPPPPPPPPPPPSSYRDEIGGTEQVPVQNSDGTYTYITKRLPLTDEQKAEEAEYKSIMQGALSEIKKLSAADYESSEETQKILTAWESEKNNFIDESFNERSEVEDKILARRGLSSSSAGDAVRRRRSTDKTEALKETAREKALLGNDIRNEKLALQQNLYNIASNRNDIDNARVLSSSANGIGAVNSINAGNRASIADYYSRQLRNNNSRLQNTSPTLFGQVLGGAANTVTSPLSSVFGPLF